MYLSCLLGPFLSANIICLDCDMCAKIVAMAFCPSGVTEGQIRQTFPQMCILNCAEADVGHRQIVAMQAVSPWKLIFNWNLGWKRFLFQYIQKQLKFY